MSGATHFFLGANSGRGFQNLFERFCEPQNYYDLLVLKGGPGAGKSTMMRKIGAAMEARGEQVEYLHCSGDPDSLDGVHFPRIRTAIVDGTAPHVIEPRYPAAVERYVNLGDFYDISAAKDARDEIERWSNMCSEAYRCAYRVLGAARQVNDNASALMVQELDTHKLMRRTEGIISRELRGKGMGEQDQYRFLGSLTCQGPVWRFDSVEKLCSRVYHLIDSAGIAAKMLEHIHDAARARLYGSILCPDPEHPERLQHLLLPELELAFVTTQEGMECSCPAYRRIHLDAMVAPEHIKRWKGRLKFMRKMTQTLREEGEQLLKEAKSAHDALEAVYLPNVDFSGVDALTERELRRIASY